VSQVNLALAALAVTLLVAVASAMGLGARRAGLSQRVAWLTAAFALCWLAFTAALAHLGVLAQWSARPPRVAWLPATLFALIILASRTRYAREVIANTPPAWPVALQTFRVIVELCLFALHQDGRAPIQVTFEGRNFDLLAGATAPLVAWMIHTRGRLPGVRLVVLAWNLAGLGLLANVVFTAATSVPGPMQLDWPGGSFEAIASWPIVWIPAFLAPMAVFLHVVSLRQTFASVQRHGWRPA
jgi:hypothetical protein